jgi:hypothetical protein
MLIKVMLLVESYKGNVVLFTTYHDINSEKNL